jgi:hypothetical protein
MIANLIQGFALNEKDGGRSEEDTHRLARYSQGD